MYDWNSIRVFLAIYRGGSLKEAARELKISVSTVSRRLSAFEEDLGVQLFQRNLDGLEATEAAIRILPHAQAIETAANSLNVESQNITSHELEGTVRLSTVPNLGSDIIAPLLPIFRERYPKITIELLLRTGLSDLSRHETDLAIRIPRPDSGDLVAKCLRNVGHSIYASSKYLNRVQKTDDLTQLDWIGWPRQLNHFPEAKWLVQHIPENRFVFRTDDVQTMIRACQAGVGVVMLHDMLDAIYPQLHKMPDNGFPIPPHLPLWLVVHQSKRHVPAIAAVWDFLVNLLEEAENLEKSREKLQATYSQASFAEPEFGEGSK